MPKFYFHTTIPNKGKRKQKSLLLLLFGGGQSNLTLADILNQLHFFPPLNTCLISSLHTSTPKKEKTNKSGWSLKWDSKVEDTHMAWLLHIHMY